MRLSFYKSCWIFACLVTLSACAESVPPPRHPLAVENRLYELEIPLAKKGELYTVFDFPHRLIRIKNRGVALRELSVLGLEIHRDWRAPAVQETLTRKGIAPVPQPTVIIPPRKTDNEEVEDTESVMVERVEDSLELEDMPAFFSVEFQSGAKILVLSRSTHPLGFFQRLSNSGVRGLFFLQRTISHRSAAATLRLAPDDARALYWAVKINQKALIAAL